jgi:hypothetical protein
MPVIALTAYLMSYIGRDNFEYAFCCIIEKPINKMQFVFKLNEIMNTL